MWSNCLIVAASCKLSVCRVLVEALALEILKDFANFRAVRPAQASNVRRSLAASFDGYGIPEYARSMRESGDLFPEELLVAGCQSQESIGGYDDLVLRENGLLRVEAQGGQERPQTT